MHDINERLPLKTIVLFICTEGIWISFHLHISVHLKTILYRNEMYYFLQIKAEALALNFYKGCMGHPLTFKKKIEPVDDFFFFFENVLLLHFSYEC